MQYVNVAAYRFFDWSQDRIREIRQPLRARAEGLGIRGTILLSPEGINLFLAGTRDSIDTFKGVLREEFGVPELTYKESFSAKQPFTRMLVKLKKEIIPIGDSTIRPHEYTGPSVSAKELKQWLDEGREVVLLDTRNDYEIAAGTFENALDLKIKTFRVFPEEIKKLPEEMKDKTIVMFCTGGIRCEKASPVMIRAGFKNVYQLDGGILKYFEEVGSSHYQGDCFVFDWRLSVDPALAPKKRTEGVNLDKYLKTMEG